MAQRSSSRILAAACCLAALWLVINATSASFVSPPSRTLQVPAEQHVPVAVRAALLGAALTAPEAAHAANQGYAILQVGWAVFIIGLGPAVLFWIYFNKPEIL